MFLAPQSNAVAATYSTTGFVALGVAETTQLGMKGVAVTYNNTMPMTVFAFVYIYLTNSAGQTIYIQLSRYSYSTGQNVTSFFGLVGVMPGTYTASLFATTNSLVPVSPVTTIKVVL